MKKKPKIFETVNWHRIITLSAAAQYINKELGEELDKIKPNKNRRPPVIKKK